MGRVKWNSYVNSKDTDLNQVSKTPPKCLQNTMPDGGQMRSPLDIMGNALRKAVLSNRPTTDKEANDLQPGMSSRQGTFNLQNFPGAIGIPGGCWTQTPSEAGKIDNNPAILSNLSDIPSVWGRKFTSQK